MILAHLPRQSKVAFEPRERIRARRDAAVASIVAHAAATVPYYRELFAREGLEARSFRSAEDLARLPLLEKEAVHRDPVRFVSESQAGRTAVPFMTSGTTGTPLEIRHDARSLLANLAYGERERGLIVEACGAPGRVKELSVSYTPSTIHRVWEFYAEHALLPVRPQRRMHSVLEPLDDLITAIETERPDVLVGYGSSLDLLFRYLRETGRSMRPPKALLYVCDAMSEESRRRIESEHGVPVFSRYNAVEAFKVGFLCEHREAFHVHEDLCHVRVVRPDGSAAAEGEVGEIVISNLVNRATVLLNYRIGDLGSLREAPCTCGRSFPLLGDLDGRREDILLSTDRRYVHPRAIWGALKHARGLLRYQLVQRAHDAFDLRVVTTDEAAYRSIVDGPLAELERMLGPAARIDSLRVDAIALEGGGKFRTTVRRTGIA